MNTIRIHSHSPRRYLPIIAALALAGWGAVAPALAQDDPRAASGEEFIAALEEVDGCLGATTATTHDGQEIVAAWFKNKAAVQRWYDSRFHRRLLQAAGRAGDRDVAAYIAKNDGPLMVVAAQRRLRGETVQFSIEYFRALPGGSEWRGRFSPVGAVPAHRLDVATELDSAVERSPVVGALIDLKSELEAAEREGSVDSLLKLRERFRALADDRSVSETAWYHASLAGLRAGQLLAFSGRRAAAHDAFLQSEGDARRSAADARHQARAAALGALASVSRLRLDDARQAVEMQEAHRRLLDAVGEETHDPWALLAAGHAMLEGDADRARATHALALLSRGLGALLSTPPAPGVEPSWGRRVAPALLATAYHRLGLHDAAEDWAARSDPGEERHELVRVLLAWRG